MNDPFVLHHQATGQLLIYVTYKYMGKDVSVLSMLHCQKKITCPLFHMRYDYED